MSLSGWGRRAAARPAGQLLTGCSGAGAQTSSAQKRETPSAWTRIRAPGVSRIGWPESPSIHLNDNGRVRDGARRGSHVTAIFLWINCNPIHRSRLFLSKGMWPGVAGRYSLRRRDARCRGGERIRRNGRRLFRQREFRLVPHDCNRAAVGLSFRGVSLAAVRPTMGTRTTPTNGSF